MRVWKRRLLAVVGAFLCASALIELTARLALSSGTIHRHLKDMDEAWQRRNWILRRAAGQRFTYTFDTFHPTRGWAVTPNLRDMRVFGDHLLSTNQRGIRGRVDYGYERTPGRSRVVVLGDSYTFGDEVSDDETYSSVLASLLPETEVLNLGVHGYGQDQMLLYLLEEGIRYRPDVVILGYVWFDAYRNLFTFNNFAKPKFDLRQGRLQLVGVPVPTPDEVLRREPWRLRTLDLAIMARERLRWATGANARRAERLTWSLLDSLLALARGAGAVPVVAYLPVLAEPRDTTAGLTVRERALDGYCRQQSARCVFLRQRFARAFAAGTAFDSTHHWTPAGHRLAAEGLADYLLSERLLPDVHATVPSAAARSSAGPSPPAWSRSTSGSRGRAPR